MILWLSLAFADVCDDARALTATLPPTLDAIDRAAFLLRDVDTLLTAREVLAGRVGTVRARGEREAHEAIDVRIGEVLAYLVNGATAADGTPLGTGAQHGDVVLPDLVGIEAVAVEEAQAWRAEAWTALMVKRTSLLEPLDAATVCGLPPLPAAPAERDGMAELVATLSARQQAEALREALAEADRAAAVVQDVLARIRELAVKSTDEYLEESLRHFVQTQFILLTETIDADWGLPAVVAWQGTPLLTPMGGEHGLPELTAWALGVDTRSMAVDTQTNALAALGDLDAADARVEEVRQQYAELGLAATAPPLVLPSWQAEGAVLPQDCTAVAASGESLERLATGLGRWEVDAQRALRDLHRVEAGAVRLATEVREPVVPLPDVDAALERLATARGARTGALPLLEGAYSVGVPGLAVDLPPPHDDAGLALEPVREARAALESDRWRVAAEHALVDFLRVRQVREAQRCGEAAELAATASWPAWLEAPEVDEALRRNREDAFAGFDAMEDQLLRTFDILTAMIGVYQASLEPGADLDALALEHLALAAQQDALAMEPLGGQLTLDGPLRHVELSVGTAFQAWVFGISSSQLGVDEPRDLGIYTGPVDWSCEGDPALGYPVGFDTCQSVVPAPHVWTPIYLCYAWDVASQYLVLLWAERSALQVFEAYATP